MSVTQMAPIASSTKKQVEVKVKVEYPEMYGYLMKQGGSFKVKRNVENGIIFIVLEKTMVRIERPCYGLL